MTKQQFKQNLMEALEFNDCEIEEKTLDNLIELNYDSEFNNLSEWSWLDFASFAIDIKCDGLSRACRLNDLKL